MASTATGKAPAPALSPMRAAIAELIRREMGAKMLPAGALAEPLGISAALARKKFKGIEAFSFDEVEAVSNWLGVRLFRAALEMSEAA